MRINKLTKNVTFWLNYPFQSSTANNIPHFATLKHETSVFGSKNETKQSTF